MNVFDFDNTIYDGESGIDLFKYYIKRYPYLLKFIPKLIVGFVRYKRHRISLQEALDSYIPDVEAFLRRNVDFDGDMKDFWDKHEQKIKPAFLPLVRDEDLIISASPELELREICRRIGIKNYLGTVIDEKTGTINYVNFRENKLKYFRQKYPGAEIDILFTDSYNDRWLMDIAKHVIMVNGNKIELVK